MTEKNQHTGILIFSRSAALEAMHKPILKNEKANRKLFRKIQNDLARICGKMNLPIVISDENSQKGKDFGEKLKNAIASFWEQGFEKMILLGNDCPELSRCDLNRTVNLLESGKTAIGPTLDGGFYLLGIAKTQFEQINFDAINWQTDCVLSQLRSQLVGCAAYELLSRKLDMDHFGSLLDLAKKVTGPIKQWIQELLRKKVFQLNFSQTDYHFQCVPVNAFRGPPIHG